METLVMPVNYVELQEGEMMYLDGSGIPNWVAEGIINTAFVLTGLGGAIQGTRAFIAMHGKYLAKRELAKNLKKVGLGFAAAYVGAFVEIIQVWANPVGKFVEFLDEADGNKNGWIF